MVGLLCGALFLCPSLVRAQNPQELFRQAREDQQAGEISASFAKLETAIELDPNLPGLSENAAWQFYLAGYLDQKTLTLFEAALPTASDPGAVQTAIGHVRAELGLEGGQAPPSAKPPGKMPDPENPSSRLQYARELFWSGSPSKAKLILMELISLKPKDPVFRLELARVLAALGDHAGAKEAIREARQLAPADTRLLAALMRVENQSKKTVSKPRSESPAEELWRRGREAEGRLDLFGARDLYREALKFHPPQPGLHEYTAWFLFLNEFHDPFCLELFEAALPTASDKKATSTAITHLRQHLGLDPARPSKKPSPMVRPAASASDAEQLRYARWLFWSGSPKESLEKLQEIQARHPKEAALLLASGNVLMALNDFKGASRDLKAAQALRPREPEIALALSRSESRQGRRTTAIRTLRGMDFPDQGAYHLARAQAWHYAGEFLPASFEYRKAIAARPHDQAAASGLTETALRTGSVPEARDLLARWPAETQGGIWSDRISLEREIAAPTLRLGSSFFGNSLDYHNWNLGGDFRSRPIDSLELGISSKYGDFSQSGYQPIRRVGGEVEAVFQPGDLWAITGRVGVYGYSNDWTSVTGGFGLMVRPFSNLQLNANIDHLDVVDSEPALGISLYDLAATIGAVGGQATMNLLSLSGTWTPVERLKVFGKYRAASLTGDNTMNDFYIDASWLVWKWPALRFGYGISRTMFSNAAPLYRDGANTTSYYYDPADLIVQNFYGEFTLPVTRSLSLGGEGHFYQQPLNGGIGTGLFGFARLKIAENQALRIDARWFSQDRGLNRDGTSSGFYNALNLVCLYELRF